MDEPKSLDEYNDLAYRNSPVTGHGLDTAQHLACPWCAAPDWKVIHIAGELGGYPDTDNQFSIDATCKNCGRTGRCQLARSENGVTMELVQTGGDDPPSWLVPAPRRL